MAAWSNPTRQRRGCRCWASFDAGTLSNPLKPSHPLTLLLFPTLSNPETMRTLSPSTVNPLTLSPSRHNGPLQTPDDVRALLAGFDLDVPSLLTVGNPKLAKTIGARSVIHHALPARGLALAIDPNNNARTAPRAFLADVRALAETHGMVDDAMRHNGCRFSTDGCRRACLNDAGHGGMNRTCVACRARRTLAMIADARTYVRGMVWALARESANATADNVPLAFRTCGTDETPWFRMVAPLSLHEVQTLKRRFGVDAVAGPCQTIADAFAPMIADGRMIPYEYLKAGVDHADGPDAWLTAGWRDVTASFAADRFSATADAVRALDAGFRVAVPIAWPKGQPLPTRAVITLTNGTTRAVPCVDGDADDARWRNPARCVVLLREKIARGADRTLPNRFILRHAHRHTLADGRLDLG
jgi:hypothetical protein